MKKNIIIQILGISSILILAIFVSAGKPVEKSFVDSSLLNNIQIEEQIVFSSDDLIFNSFLGYDIVLLKDSTSSCDVGYPMIPIKQIQIALPPDMKVNRVRTIDITSQEINGEYTLFPAQPPIPTNSRSKELVDLIINQDIYKSRDIYPSNPVEFVYQSDLAGQGIAVINLYPLRYIPESKKLVLHTSMTIEIEGEHGYVCGDYLLTVISASGKMTYEKMIKNIVINPEDVQLQTNPNGEPKSLVLPPDGPFDHVIITRTSDISYWEPLAEWHTKRGLRDTVVDTTYIYSSYSGSDNQEKIRNFIIDAHNTWGTLYFLMCGEHSDVPFEYRTYEGTSIPSDQYYGDFDDDWDYEVYVGRSTARGGIQVSRFVEKILKYEQDPPLSDYILDITLLGMDLTLASEPPYYLLTRGEYLKEQIDSWYIPAHFVITEIYDTNAENHRTAFLTALNNGQNLVNHDDHSYDWVLGTGDRNHGWYITDSDVDDLTNDNKMSNIYSLGCYPNAMDDPNGYDCIAEHFVIYNELQAGISFTGNTRDGWFYVGDPYSLSSELDQDWWRGLFVYNNYRLGETLAYTKNNNPTSGIWSYCQWTLNLLGEPAMPLWTDTPATFDVSYPANIPVGPSSFTVHVEEVGAGNVQNAYVCLWKDDEIYLTANTNVDGNADFNPSPSTIGTMYVTVTMQNYLPYEGSAEVVESPNDPPNTPTIDGTTYGYFNYEYTYTALTTDPNNDQIYYLFDWDDGNFSEWLGPYSSGVQGETLYAWAEPGMYNVKSKAKDEQDAESPWSVALTVTITIPGDFNDDCVVDFTDFTIFSGAYGSSQGDPNWNPLCDLDNSNNIDFTDFTLFSSYYGKTCNDF